ncbi:MAG: hypothetical protein AABX11_07670 [Nanoarchaeota archaeon]
MDTINQLANKGNISSNYILAIINSRLTNWYAYRFIFGKAIRTMQFDNPVTERIMIAKPSKVQEDSVSQLIDKMLSLNKRLNEIGDTETEEKKQIKREIERTDKEIDDKVYELYEITEEEKTIIEESLAH